MTALGHSAVMAQNDKDTTRQYYYRLATSKDAADRALVTGKLYEGLKSNKEKDWMLAMNMFSVMKKKATSDSLLTVIKAHFPNGETWRNEEVQTIYNAGTAAEKEAAYNKWLKKYPMNKFEGSRIMYDYAANSVASAFAEEKNVKKALYYGNLCQTPAWKGEAWAGVASRLEKNGFTAEALPLFKKAMDNAYAFKTTRTKEEGAQFAAMGYRGYCTSIARIYLKQIGRAHV